jgi:hypothetical protein
MSSTPALRAWRAVCSPRCGVSRRGAEVRGIKDEERQVGGQPGHRHVEHLAVAEALSVNQQVKLCTWLWHSTRQHRTRQATQAGTPAPGPNHDHSELQPPYQRQAVRNSVCALSDYKFYSFFTLTVHFSDALIVYLP